MNHLILDGYNLIHRAKGGFQAGDWPVVFNFFRGLKPFVERYKPSKVYFVLEGNPKRNIELLPQYKANRSPAPDDFSKQKNEIIDILKRMPIEIIYHPNFEADDVIHNIVKNIKIDEPIAVVSSDSDFMQLLQHDLRGSFVRKNLVVYNWRDKVNLERPEYDYVKWKALRGDPTDNIPKCPKMNDKTAMMLVNDELRFNESMSDNEFKSIFERNLEIIKLQDFSDEEMKELVVIKGNVDWDYVRNKFQSFDFKSMTNDVSWNKYKNAFAGIK